MKLFGIGPNISHYSTPDQSSTKYRRTLRRRLPAYSKKKVKTDGHRTPNVYRFLNTRIAPVCLNTTVKFNKPNLLLLRWLHVRLYIDLLIPITPKKEIKSWQQTAANHLSHFRKTAMTFLD